MAVLAFVSPDAKWMYHSTKPSSPQCSSAGSDLAEAADIMLASPPLSPVTRYPGCYHELSGLRC